MFRKNYLTRDFKWYLWHKYKGLFRLILFKDINSKIVNGKVFCIFYLNFQCSYRKNKLYEWDFWSKEKKMKYIYNYKSINFFFKLILKKELSLR